MGLRGVLLAASAAAALAAGYAAWSWTGAREPPAPGPGPAASRGAPAADTASREADDILDAVRRGRLSSALGGIVAFLRRFSPGDLDPARREGFAAARVDAGTWGLAEAESLALAGDVDGAESLLAKALAALEGTPAEEEARRAAARVRGLVERHHASAAAKEREQAMVPAEKAVAEARAKAAGGKPEEALADLLLVLEGTRQPDARRRIEGEVGGLRRTVSRTRERQALRKKADQAIARGDYAGARKILESLVEGAEGAEGGEAASAEVASDREKLEGVKELEGFKEPEALAALRRGLRWMTAQQLPDGSFSVALVGNDGKKLTDKQRMDAAGLGRNRAGLTGLASTALLGHVRYDITDEFAPALGKSLAWLAAAQKKEGHFSNNMYENAIGALTLVDADRLLRRNDLRPAAARAIQWLLEAQNADGGWRYGPRNPPSDVSVTGWALQALLHAKMGGYEVKQDSIDLAISYVDRMTDPVTGRVGYVNPGQGSYAMTGAALFCRLRYGQGPGDDRVRLAAEVLVRGAPGKSFGEGAYALFYASDGMSRLGGTWWSRWAPGLKKYLLDTQVKEGDAAGAWPSANDPWGRREDVGPVFVAALHSIALENFFEHRE